MAEFIHVGNRRINVDCIHAVTEESDGSVLVHYDRGGIETFKGDDAAAFLEWADSHRLATPKADAAKKARADAEKKAKADEEEAVSKALEAEARKVKEEAAAKAKAEHPAPVPPAPATPHGREKKNV